MKLEFNKQRVIGIAIVVLFLLVAIPFLLAGNKKIDVKGDEQVAMATPTSGINSESQADQAPDEVVGTSATESSPEKINNFNSNSASSTAKLSDKASDNSIVEDDLSLPENITASSANSSEHPEAAQNVKNNQVTAVIPPSTSAVGDSSASVKASAASNEASITPTSAVLFNNENAVTQDSKANKTATTKATQKASTLKIAAAKAKPNKSSRKVKIKKQYIASNTTFKQNKIAKTNVITNKTTSFEDKKWVVRVGYHEKKDSYKKIVELMHKKGYKHIYAKKVSINNKEVINIFVGPMLTRKEAEKTAAKLSTYLKKKVVVIKKK